ncbi:MAG: hypothetical protein OJF50_006744 [Nitrospira sp.]|jgi:hypothetical protein|nr:hypothetical protein [Nitrospira sp.]
MNGIYRVDHEPSRTHSWFVTVQRRNRIYHRHFSDGLHSSKRKALQAAKAYRDSLIKQYQPLTRKEFCVIRKKNNRSGVSGVTRHEAPGRTPTSPRQIFWLAQWPIGGGRAKKRKFSISKYGERGAYLRALRARRNALKALGQEAFRRPSTSA